MALFGGRDRSVLLAVTLLAAIAAVCVGLGRWQWHRAAESRALAAQFAAADEAAPRPLPPADEDLARMRYHRVQVGGRFEPELQFLLDNRVHEGAAGYEVLTPFRVADTDRLLLVNRGWIRADPDRSRLPDVAVDTRERRLIGRIDILPRAGLELGGGGAPPGGGLGVEVVSYPSAAELAARLGRATFGYQLLLDPNEPDGFVRDWRVGALPPERHVAYAGQWFLFAATALAIALGIIVRTQRSKALS